MATCPNKNLQEWKDLVLAVGENDAYYYWDKHKTKIPASILNKNEDLDTRLEKGFFADFNFTVNKYDSIQKALGYDTTQMVDFVEKIVDINEGTPLDKAAAFLGYKLLGKDNGKLRGTLRYRIRSWSKYNEKFNKYRDEINDTGETFRSKRHFYERVRDKIIVDFLAETIVEYDKNPEEFKKTEDRAWSEDDFTLFERLIRAIKEIFISLTPGKSFELLNDIAVQVAEEIVTNNYTYLKYDLQEDQLLKGYEETIATDSFAREIIESHWSRNIILTGSLALRKQGTLFRTVKENLHDLDFIVPYDIMNNIYNWSIARDLLSIGRKYNGTSRAASRKRNELALPLIDKLDFIKALKKEYPSYKVLRGFYGDPETMDEFTVTGVINGEYYTESGTHIEIKKGKEKIIKHKPGDWIKDTGYLVDNFLYLTPQKTVDSVNLFQGWKEIVKAKLSMSRGKDLIDHKYFTSFTKSSSIGKFVYSDYIYMNNDTYAEETKNSPRPNVMNQSSDVPASIASKETVAMMEEVAKAMGINTQTLLDYAKENPEVDITNLNGLADLTKKVIALAEGREAEAIVEEVVHIATAMIEQISPELITTMIKEIDKFAIYKIVFDKYKNLKAYQLPNGKPDIRKIKKEAADKLITEIINNGENTEQFPELREPAVLNFWEALWQKILAKIGVMYKRANIDIFKQIAGKITSGQIKPSNTLLPGGIFSQTAAEETNEPNKELDAFYDKMKHMGDKMELHDAIEEGPNKDKRHYTIIEATGEISRITRSVTEKIKEFAKEVIRTGKDKIIDDFKKEWGTEGHNYLKDFIINNLIDINGYALTTPLKNKINTELDESISSKIETFAIKLIASYKPGTRFLIENMITDDKRSIGSAIDFLALEPYTKKDGTKSFYVDTLDWKFTSIKEKENTDIPWFKKDSWVKQMKEYTKLLYNNGVNHEQIRKARMIPFVVNYEEVFPMFPENGIYPSTLRVSSIDDVNKEDIFILPVPIETEKTGIVTVDRLVKSLYAYGKKIYKTVETDISRKQEKNVKLNELSVAIRHLQVSLNFSPLVNIGRTFVKSAEDTVNKYKDIDYSTLKFSEMNAILKELIAIQKSANKFTNIDRVFTDVYTENLSKEDKKTLSALERLSKDTYKLLPEIDELQSKFAVQLKIISEIGDPEKADDILSAEKSVNFISGAFLEASKLPIKLLNLGANLVLRANKIVDIKFKEEMIGFRTLLNDIEKEAKVKGVPAFSLIGKMTKGTLKLIYKVDESFHEALKKARKDQNKKFIMENIHMDAFNADVKEYMNKQEKFLSEYIWDPTSEENNDRIATSRISMMRNSIDINRKTFKGWNDFTFVTLMNKHRKEEDHLSAEYKEMAKSPAALAMWNHFTKLNNRARDMGYLVKKGQAFFPLIEATMMQKLAASDGVVTEFKDFFKDLGRSKIEEKKAYGKVDPETGEVKAEIPTYFTKTDKRVEQLSQDLGKIGAMYTRALLEYQSQTNMENIMLTLYEVEKTKKSLRKDERNNLIRRDDGQGFELEENTVNAKIFKEYINDAIYGVSDDNTVKDPDIKKALDTANTYLRIQGVGLRWPLTIANWFGTNFHAYINSTGLYRFWDYEKNNLSILSNTLSLEKKAVVDMISPLTEDPVIEEIRKAAWGNSYSAYLSAWTFSDIMQVSNSFPDKLLQIANAATFVENSMIVDGAIVNIREYVIAQEQAERVNLSFEERKQLKKTREAKILAFKESSSLDKLIIVDEKGARFPAELNITKNELAKFSVKVSDHGRKLNGQMDDNNKATYRRNVIFRSFMMFKSWIPKMISQRTLDIHYSAEQGNWEYGRSLAYFETLKKIGLYNIFSMQSMLLGTEEGMKIMDQMLEEKKKQYYEATGQVLNITNEEYYDLMEVTLTSQIRELRLVVGVIAMVLAAKAAAPPEEASTLEKNRYKYWTKAINKISDELTFYYNPFTFQTITKGNVIPALNILVNIGKFFTHLSTEAYGRTLDDAEMIDKSYPAKYFLNMIPGAYQGLNDVLPFLDPELAKEFGVRVTPESRRN